MEVIQHNMPVDDVHFCVRIKEIMGGCDEVLSDEKSTDTELDEDCTSSNDDSFGKEDVHSEEDGDDFYDDGSDCNLFMDEVEGEIQISPQSGSCNMVTFLALCPDTHIEERSPCTQGINIRNAKKKNSTSDAVTKPTSSLDTSISDNESNIQRCNNWLLNSISKSTTNKDIDDEVLKTIEVDSLLGFNMIGKEDMVRQTIGDNIVQS
ncbi:hypothetical protein Tco_0282693 [Tanacetum coccineum]